MCRRLRRDPGQRERLERTRCSPGRAHRWDARPGAGNHTCRGYWIGRLEDRQSGCARLPGHRRRALRSFSRRASRDRLDRLRTDSMIDQLRRWRPHGRPESSIRLPRQSGNRPARTPVELHLHNDAHRDSPIELVADSTEPGIVKLETGSRGATGLDSLRRDRTLTRKSRRATGDHDAVRSVSISASNTPRPDSRRRVAAVFASSGIDFAASDVLSRAAARVARRLAPSKPRSTSRSRVVSADTTAIRQ